jgi:putative sugar O-methyltransferase
MERTVSFSGTDNIEASVVNHWFSAQQPGHPKYYQYACWMLYQHLKQRDAHNIVDRVSPSSDSVAVDLDGRLMSWDMLISIHAVLGMAEIDNRILTEPLSVLDLGAGWGRIGYVLKTLNPSLTYIACDIPVSLLVAESYLPTVLPDEPVHGYMDSRWDSFDHDRLIKDGGIRFCGSHDLPRFEPGAIDMFVNVASFQEMTMEQVELYMNEIGRLSGALYHMQRLAGDELVRENYPYPPKWEKVFDRSIMHMPRYFEAGYLV